MSNYLSSSDPVNPPTVPQRSAAIVSPDGRWALYHETIDSPDIPETSYYLVRTSRLNIDQFIWADEITLFCQAQMNQITYFFTLTGPQFALHLANAGHVGTLMTILKAVHVAYGNMPKTRELYVAIAVSGIGTGTTSARPSASEVDDLGYSSRPGGQILRCLVFKLRRKFPHIRVEGTSSDILETIEVRYVPFPTRVSMGPRNFDICTKGLALVAQTEGQSQAQHGGISDVYFIPFDQLPTPAKLKVLNPIRMKTNGITGSASVPVLSPSGPFCLAFLKRNDNSTERGETFIFIVSVDRVEDRQYNIQRISVSRRLIYWVDSRMSIVEILIPTRDVYNPLPSTWVVTDFDHGGSILGIDCLNKSRLLDGDPRLLISRASANGSTDSLIYSADTRDRSMVQCASIGEVTTEQNQDNSNEIGGHFGDLTEDRIIEDWITENREEVSQESDDIEDEIIEDEIVDNRGVGDDSDGIEDRIIEDGFIEDRVIEDMIAEHRADVINEDREEAINTSKDITDRIGEDREEVINENNVPADGIIENREQSDHESENENDPLEPPFSALENRGGQADSPLRRHSSHILIIQWLEARRRRGLPELEL
ncbi:uncharacterized protein EAE97_008208 [Botrytis byssoidea]|uniref:Uncharacterized protein n=1 Tax=Botrytis byssoidea TaxID=139641 RepID=A0A9P5IEV8_9HELO|nr:uncharacterized protein EAE97_008208 [Botrytis byssoidea]KAF7935301.1 hypothetical protein EAE97_008208 [Botrytis byssoidea]